MTNEEAINIIQTSNDKLAMQIDSLKHGTALLDEDRDSLYQCLEYCRKEHEACEIAIKSLKLEVNTLRTRLHGLSYDGVEQSHGEYVRVVDLSEIDDLFDELEG